MALKNRLKAKEGWSAIPYLDSEGFWTIGWGHKIADAVLLYLIQNHGAKNLSITSAQGEALLDADIKVARGDLKAIFFGKFFDPVREGALTEMLFNLGRAHFLDFTKMRRAIFLEDWNTAAAEALDSHWSKVNHAKSTRDEEIAEMLRTGKEPA